MTFQATWQQSGDQTVRGEVGARPSLEVLAAKSDVELERLYRGGAATTEFFTRSGRPKGRMLAVRHLERPPVGGALRRFAAKGGFPWGGKSFFAVSPDAGRGINRVRLGPLRFEWYPFDTRIEPSLVDGKDTVLLDYDKPENPIFIRPIRDEIREIAPGLFLGPAMWKRGSGATHVLWFALDFNDPEPERA